MRRIAPLLERFGTRLDPAYAGWAVGKPSGTGIIQGWFELADGRPLDPIALLLAVDALPPVTFDLGLPGWAPTLELTAHVRASPAPGWAIVRHATRNISGGQFEEDCEVWDSDGPVGGPVAPARAAAQGPGERPAGLDGLYPFCADCGLRLVSGPQAADTYPTGAEKGASSPRVFGRGGVSEL